MTPVSSVGLSHDDAARTAMERSSLYGFLAAIFRAAPTAALLRRMKETGFREAFAAAGGGLESGFLDGPEDQLLEELAVEYTRLFLGPGKHIQPYSAVHLGGEGASLWGKPTVWVRRFIEAAGFDLQPAFHALPDHIAVEFEFMQEMTRRQAAAWERRDDAGAAQCQEIESEFITAHMSRWVPVFCEKVARAAELPLYREIARVTADFVKSEQEEAHGHGERTATAAC